MSNVENVISDEAVEAATEVMALEMGTPFSPTIYRHLARKALKAAAPFMQSDADKEVQRLRDELELVYSTHPANPYRIKS